MKIPYALSLCAAFLLACSSTPEEPEDLSDATCFIGDSITYLWDLEKYFPDMQIIKHAVCAAVVEDVETWDVSMCKGKRIVYLMGTNNIWDRIDGVEEAAEVRENFGNFFAYQASLLGGKPLLYISILPRNDVYIQDTMVTANVRLQNLVTVRKLDSMGVNFRYVDVFDDFIEKGNVIDSTLFEDGLHPNDKGYEILAEKLRPFLE